jgi:PAS domain S-box-containing protein
VSLDESLTGARLLESVPGPYIAKIQGCRARVEDEGEYAPVNGATSGSASDLPPHPPGAERPSACDRAHEQAEAALRPSESDLAEAQRVARLGSWRFDLATNAARWSKELYRIFEIEEQAFDGTYEAFLSCVHPDDRPRVVQANAEAKADGKPFELEYRVVTRTGQFKTIREVGYAVKDAAGKIVSLFGTAQDITDRKRAEEALWQTNARLRVILEASPLPIISVDAEGRIESWNQAAERVFGWSATEAIGHLCPGVPPQEMEDYLAMVRRAMEGEPSLGLVRYRRKNGGSPLICNISAAPQRNAQGQAIGVTIIVEDITARHQAEEAVRESQQLLHLVLETLPVGVAVTDRAGNIILVNAASKRIWGDTIVSGRERWTQTKGFWHDSGQRIAPENWASVRALSEGQTSLNELIDIDTYDGQQKTILNSSAPIRNPAGVIVGAVFVNEDVTERVRAEEALHQLTGQLLRLQDEERRRLARELHDATAQKLAVLLLGLKSLTAQASSLDARAQESLAECQALAKQCADELRTFSYLLHPPLLEELGLAGAVRDYADGFAQRSGLRVDLEVSPSLERLPREKELAIFRVLQESLANVHRHSGSKTVSIRLTQLRGEIRLEVQDAGRGLELKTDPASGEKAPSKLGVGVAGMRERLRQLGGRLEFESGHPGTTVRASLPLDQSGSEHSDDQNPDCRRS